MTQDVALAGRYPHWRYHATVRAIPVGRSVAAAKSSRRLAFVTSYTRLCVRKSSLLRVSGADRLRRRREPVTEPGHRLGREHGDMPGRQPGPFSASDHARQFGYRHWLASGEVEALAKCRAALAATHQRFGHVVDVDRVQPGLTTADGPEPPAQNRLEERKKMKVPGPVDEPGPGDDRRKAVLPAVRRTAISASALASS